MMVQSWTNDVWSISGQQQTSNTDSWLLAIVTISNDVTQFRFRSVRGSGYKSDMAVDDITVQETPSCPIPTDLTVTYLSSDQAELSWTDNAGANVWNIEFGTAGFTPTGTPTTSNVTNPYLMASLTPQTSYEFYVQADCGGNDTSDWAGPYTFTTPPVNNDLVQVQFH